MDFDPREYGLLDDGSTIETITAQIQEGMVEEAVEAFQEVFAEYRPEGFKMLFSAVDVAHKRLIWVHRYAPGFDLTNRFYPGKYPKFTHCLWGTSRFDALEALPEELQPK